MRHHNRPMPIRLMREDLLLRIILAMVPRNSIARHPISMVMVGQRAALVRLVRPALRVIAVAVGLQRDGAGLAAGGVAVGSLGGLVAGEAEGVVEPGDFLDHLAEGGDAGADYESGELDFGPDHGLSEFVYKAVSMWFGRGIGMGLGLQVSLGPIRVTYTMRMTDVTQTLSGS